MRPGNAEVNKEPKKKKKGDEPDCTRIDAPRMVLPEMTTLGYDWIEIICYPYIFCIRIFQYCTSLFAGTNLFLVCWLILQWLTIKISNMTSPDPVLFPYYLNIFFQVVTMGAIFTCLWLFFGRTIVVPYFMAIYDTYVHSTAPKTDKTFIHRAMSVKKYCFKKSEIFDSPIPNNAIDAQCSYLCIYTIGASLYYLLRYMFRQ